MTMTAWITMRHWWIGPDASGSCLVRRSPKAQRIRREGKMDVHDIDSNQIYATVHGDHGDYDVMIVKGGLGGNSITRGLAPVTGADMRSSARFYNWPVVLSRSGGWLEMRSQELSDAARGIRTRRC